MGIFQSKSKRVKETESVDPKVLWKVLWDYNCSAKGHISVKHGDEVSVEEVHRPKDRNYISAVVQKIGSEQRGWINGAFIAVKRLQRDWNGLREKWYVGERSSIETSICLRHAGPGAENKGSFLICCPEEMRNPTDSWPDFAIVFRRRNVREEKALQSRYKKTDGLKIPPKFKETVIPTVGDELSSAIVYCRIRRGKDGCYLVDDRHWFENLYALLFHYQREKNVHPNARLGTCPTKENIWDCGLTVCPVPPPPSMPGFAEYDPNSTEYQQDSALSSQQITMTSSMVSTMTAEPTMKIVETIDQSQFNWSQVPLVGLGGKSRFGILTYKGEWKEAKIGRKEVIGRNLKALAKYMEDGFESEKERDFKLRSDYIVPFYGITYLDEQNFLVISEFYDVGPLDEYLRGRRKSQNCLPTRGLIEVIMQIACGMRHAERVQVLHRNLAARNVTVAKESADTICVKISDFGSLGAMDNREFWKDFNLDRLSYKWMALEVLKDGTKFSHFSDVWSFGIVMYEVVTHGEEPYKDMDLEILKAHLETGERLPPSEMDKIPEFLRGLALSCWDEVEEKRPNFERLTSKFCKWIYTTLTDSSDNSPTMARSSPTTAALTETSDDDMSFTTV